MFNYRILVVLAGLVILCSALLAADKPSPTREQLNELMGQRQRLREHGDQLAKASKTASRILQLLVRDVEILDHKIGERSAPPEYTESLRRDFALLARVKVKSPDRSDIKRLRRAAASIHLKALNAGEDSTMFTLTWAGKLPEKPASQLEVFNSLNSTLEDTGRKVKIFEPFDDGASELFSHAGNAVRVLTKQTESQDVLSDYLLSLRWDTHLLALAGTKMTHPLVAAVYFREAAEDLLVKAESSRTGDEKKRTPFSEVRTKVETKDRDDHGKPKKGYEVWYIPRGLFGDPRHKKRFKKFSTPSVENRVPGCYEMWTEKDKREGEEAEIDVKDNGKGLCPVDLWIPKQG